MREIRPSGVTRGERAVEHGMRVVSHKRGNPDTDVDRSLNAIFSLSYSTRLAIDAIDAACQEDTNHANSDK